MMTPSHRRLSGPGLCLAAWLLAGSASAQIVIRASAGFDGQLRMGQPNPVTVRIDNRTGRVFRGRLGLEDQGMFALGGPLVERTLEVSPGVTRQVTLLLRGSPEITPVVVIDADERCDFADGNASTATVLRDVRHFSVPLGDLAQAGTPRQVLVLGARQRQIRGALLEQYRADETSAILYRGLGGDDVDLLGLDAEFAPDTWLAYDGLAAIVWTEPDLAQLQNPAQLRALLDWVQFGGRLIVLGASRPALLNDAGLAGLLPLSDVSFARTDYPGPPAGLGGPLLNGAERSTARVASAGVAGFAAGLPEPLERPLGMGWLRLARFDPLVYDLGDPTTLATALARATALPLTYRADVGRELSQPALPLPQFPTTGMSGVDHVGSGLYRHLANQNVLVPPLGLFFVLAVLFVLLIGPIDYAVLKRLGKLRWSPWTLLAYTALFAGASVGASFVLFAPGEQINRIAMLDFTEDDAGREQVSGTLHHGIYAPLGGDYQPTLRDCQCFGGLVTGPWNGGQGVEPFGPAARVEQAFLGAGAQPLILRLPFNALRVTGHRLSGQATGGLSLGARRVAGRIEVSVHNGLGVALLDARLVTSSRVLVLGELPAGGAAVVDLAGLRPRAAAEWEAVFSAAEQRREAGAAPGADFDAALLAISVGADAQLWPWPLGEALGEGRVLLFARAAALPFDDGLDPRVTGLCWVYVRKLCDLPKDG